MQNKYAGGAWGSIFSKALKTLAGTPGALKAFMPEAGEQAGKAFAGSTGITKAFLPEAGEQAGKGMLNWAMKHPMLTAGGFGLGATALNALEAGAEDVSDVIKKRYLAMNDPTWAAMGQAQLYGQNDPLQQFIKQREAIYKLKYDMPVDLAGQAAGGLMGELGSGLKGMLTGGGQSAAFNSISQTPQVQALGRAKAQQIFDQVAALAPNVVTKAPGVALSVMDSAIASGSTALRPELASSLTQAAEKLARS